jgi:hypothetical protein
VNSGSNRFSEVNEKFMFNQTKQVFRLTSLALFLPAIVSAATILMPAGFAEGQATAVPASSASPYRHKHISPYHSTAVSTHARDFYQIKWGVDSLSAKLVESGQMIRFSYRVIDAGKAKVLNDKKSDPFLIDEKAHVKLVVPNLEKVGDLRQTTSSGLEAGRLYWVVFSNKGRVVKAGNRVSIVIGKFRADGLVVQ